MTETILFTPTETARQLRIHPKTLYVWDEAGLIPAPVKVGKRKRWNREELLAWVRAECPARAKWEQVYRP